MTTLEEAIRNVLLDQYVNVSRIDATTAALVETVEALDNREVMEFRALYVEALRALRTEIVEAMDAALPLRAFGSIPDREKRLSVAADNIMNVIPHGIVMSAHPMYAPLVPPRE